MCLFIGFFAQAQGKIVINEASGIRYLVDNYVRINKGNPYIQGWRIQIITTDDRRKMENAMGKFRSLYPDMISDWEHRSPYYLVKVGAFRDKLDYQKFLLEIKQDFPSSIPIIEKVRKEELLRS